MIYVVMAGQFLVIFALLYLLDHERTRHRQIQSEERRSIMALVDKESVLVADNDLPRPSGKVTYMDEAKEAEIDASAA